MISLWFAGANVHAGPIIHPFALCTYVDVGAVRLQPPQVFFLSGVERSWEAPQGVVVYYGRQII
jgi:hypothetical protein